MPPAIILAMDGTLPVLVDVAAGIILRNAANV